MKKIKVALGIITRKVLTGPLEVSIDVTRKCTTNCIMCWNYSPLRNKVPSSDWQNEHLNWNIFKQLIDDLKRLKVKRIIFGGDGDPFLHPQIREMIKAVTRTGAELSIATGGLYFNEDKIRKLFDLGVDSLNISLHAATTETFLRTHPALKEEAFTDIRNCLILLAELKKAKKRNKPFVQMINVICRVNYPEVVKMIEFAKEVRADAVDFKRMDTIPETRALLLTENQLRELRHLLSEAARRAVELGVKTNIELYRRYALKGVKSGKYTLDFYSKMPCYVGWRSARVLVNGYVIPCCGCYNLPLGDLSESKFSEIWRSPKYKDFRQESINIMRKAHLKDKCGCHSCADFTANLGIYRKLHPFKAKKFSTFKGRR